MKTLAVFMPFVLPHVQSCPRSVARQALVSAAIEFCEQSQIVQRTLDAVSTREGGREYTAFVPRHQAIAMLLRGWFKGRVLEPVAQESIKSVEAYRDDVPDVTATTGEPKEVFHLGTNKIGLYPVPDEAETGVLTLRAALRPTRDATQLDDVLYDDWVETIAAGALARLHQTPGQPYTDATRAAAREMEFRRGIRRARNESLRGRIQADLSVQMRPFA